MQVYTCIPAFSTFIRHALHRPAFPEQKIVHMLCNEQFCIRFRKVIAFYDRLIMLRKNFLIPLSRVLFLWKTNGTFKTINIVQIMISTEAFPLVLSIEPDMSVLLQPHVVIDKSLRIALIGARIRDEQRPALF